MRPKLYSTEELKIRKEAAINKWQKSNPDKIKNNRLKRDFGITLDDYNQMLFKQSGCCAICNIHHTEFSRALYVDHCHTTGKIRGLLCNSCNLVLGKIKDNITILKQSIKYLKHYGI